MMIIIFEREWLPSQRRKPFGWIMFGQGAITGGNTGRYGTKANEQVVQFLSIRGARRRSHPQLPVFPVEKTSQTFWRPARRRLRLENGLAL